MNLLGLHHITAIAGEPRRNVDFYTRVLGLRLVKKTVNFDDPTTYHLYYGDSVGTPGSILTFFPWSGIPKGRPGTGQAYATSFSVPAGSLEFWFQRLKANDVQIVGAEPRWGEETLRFTDPDGMVVELIATAEADPRPAWSHPEISAEVGIRGFHSVTLAVNADAPTAKLLTETMGYRPMQAEGGRSRFTTGASGPGTYVDVLVDPSLPRGLQGAGTVHHVAFRTADDATQATDRVALSQLGLHVSPVMDRNYFHSIYYREPAGILFEIATDPPGFAIDESVETLGEGLMLPAQYESHRAEIETALPSLK